MEDFPVLPADTISPFNAHFTIFIKNFPLLPRYLVSDISAAVRWFTTIISILQRVSIDIRTLRRHRHISNVDVRMFYNTINQVVDFLPAEVNFSSFFVSLVLYFIDSTMFQVSPFCLKAYPIDGFDSLQDFYATTGIPKGKVTKKVYELVLRDTLG